MEASCYYLPYEQTNAFSKLAIDYIKQDEKLAKFYRHPVSLDGIKAAITERKKFSGHRALLVDELRKQYFNFNLTEKQELHLQSLLSENTFTITTAHQPNIFTGPLYFIYKIIHAIKLADELATQLPEYQFVPVYYMGSEDADLDELGHIWIDAEKLEWQTGQCGAVGRMHTKGLEMIIARLEGEFAGLPYGNDMVALCKKAYQEHATIQEATLYLVNELFKEYGLLILIPDNASLKKVFNPIVRKELQQQFSHQLVVKTIDEISRHYKVQAAGRDLNLFYLNEAGRRERIEFAGNNGEKRYRVSELQLEFSEAEILDELEHHPERFSANVILRGLFQETILPNIVFIGGGGELAYWMELKSVFEATGIPYPMLVLRNSFLLIDEKQHLLQQRLGLSHAELFMDVQALMNHLLTKPGNKKLGTEQEQMDIYQLYERLQLAANDIDPSLKAHIAALHVSSLKGLKELEKKMLRAERRNHADRQRQLEKLKAALFPSNNLQERIDNFMPLYAKYGAELIHHLYKHSLSLEQQFGVVGLTVVR